MTRRINDHDGAAWPITGHRCTICRMPLDPTEPGQTTHPGCRTGDERQVYIGELRDIAAALGAVERPGQWLIGGKPRRERASSGVVSATTGRA